MPLAMHFDDASVRFDLLKSGVTGQLTDDLARWWRRDAASCGATRMHIDDGTSAELLSAKVEEGKEATGVVGMPVRYHYAFNGRKRCAKTRKVARQGLGFGTCIEEREVGVCLDGVMRFLGHSYCKLTIGLLVSARAQLKLRNHGQLRETRNRRCFSDRVMSDEVSMRTTTELFKWEHGHAGERVDLRRLVCEMVPQLMGETWRQF
jgi:hypothetical protein